MEYFVNRDFSKLISVEQEYSVKRMGDRSESLTTRHIDSISATI